MVKVCTYIMYTVTVTTSDFTVYACPFTVLVTTQ